MLQKSPGKQEPVYSEIINGQDSKEPQYMEITTKQAGSVAMQHILLHLSIKLKWRCLKVLTPLASR